MEDEQKSTIDYILQYWWVIILFLFWIVYNNRLGEFHWDQATVYVIGALIVVYIYKSSWQWFKFATPKLVANNLHTSTDGTYYNAGNYAIFTIGDVKAGGFYWKGTDGLVIAPVTSVNKLGHNVVITARVERVPIEELAPEVITVISERNFKGPYYLGLIDEEQELATPDSVYLENENKQRNKENKFLRELIGKYGIDVENYISRMMRLSDRAKGGITGKVKDLLFKDGPK